MLKGDQYFNEADSEVSFFMFEEAEAGIIAAYPPSNVVLPPALDDKLNVAIVPTTTSNKPIGILMDNVVDIDRTKFTLFESKRQVAMDSVNGYAPKVEIIRKGWFVTDMVDTGSSPNPGDAAHFIAGGLFSTTTTSMRVGTFESDKDSSGFVRVRIDL